MTKRRVSWVTTLRKKNTSAKVTAELTQNGGGLTGNSKSDDLKASAVTRADGLVGSDIMTDNFEQRLQNDEAFEANSEAASVQQQLAHCPFIANIVPAPDDDVFDDDDEAEADEEPVYTRRTLSKSQLRDYREAFRLFDKDGDGNITTVELDKFMRSLGQNAMADELRQMLRELDTDGDGTVNFEEFVDILERMSEESYTSSAEDEERELRDAFRVFDKHNRGFITASDLRAVLGCLGENLCESDIEDMIKEVDVDGDGRIDFFEFARVLGEPDTNSEGEDDDDIDPNDEENPDATETSVCMRTSNIRTIITSPVDSPRTSMSADDGAVAAGPSSGSVLRPSPNKRSTARQMNTPKAKSRTCRSVSPNQKLTPRRLSNPFYERLRSPSLKESLLTSSTPAINKERRPSRISDEVARLSEASFRESYNAIAKPNSDSVRSPYALDFSSLEALRESYKNLARMANGENSSGSNELSVDGASSGTGRMSATVHKRTASQKSWSSHESRDFTLDMADSGCSISEYFDLLDLGDDGGSQSAASEENVELQDMFVLAYQSVPGFATGAFYMARAPLQCTPLAESPVNE